MLDRLPISDYVKKYYRERKITFSDFECANIIWNSTSPWQEKLLMLQEIVGVTADEGLKRQVAERVSYEQNEYTLFMESDGGFVYRVTQYDDGSGTCFFSNVESAIGWGVENCKTNVLIDKIAVDPSDGEECVGTCKWAKDGKTVLSFISHIANAWPENTYGKPDRFEGAFIPLAYPFERGDIVRDISSGTIGVISTSKKRWNSFIERVQSGQLHGDYTDRSVAVEYFGEDGGAYYDHCNILYLEKVSSCENNAALDLLACMSRIMHGEDALFWDLFYLREKYIKSLHN